MIIKQEETSPITDQFDRLKLNVAFHGIEEQSTDRVVDSELLKTYAEETVKLLKDFIKGIESVERDIEKKKNKESFREKLQNSRYDL